MLRLTCALLTALPGIASAVHAVPAAATPQTPAIQTGTYDLTIAFGGGTMEGVLQLTASGDSLIAKLRLSEHESPIRITERRGNRLILESTVTGMQIRYELEFRGETVAGPFTYQGDPGTVTGRRRQTGER